MPWQCVNNTSTSCLWLHRCQWWKIKRYSRVGCGGEEKRGYRILKRSLAFNIWSLHSSDDQPYNDGSLKIECYTASLKPQNSGNFKSSVSLKLFCYCTCSRGNFDNRNSDPIFKIHGNSAVVWTNDSLVFFFYFGKWPLKFWGVIWPKNSLVLGDLAKDSLVLIKPWHQGVFCPDHPNTKESLGQITPQNFKGHFPKTKKTPRSHLSKLLQGW